MTHETLMTVKNWTKNLLQIRKYVVRVTNAKNREQKVNSRISSLQIQYYILWCSFRSKFRLTSDTKQKRKKKIVQNGGESFLLLRPYDVLITFTFSVAKKAIDWDRNSINVLHIIFVTRSFMWFQENAINQNVFGSQTLKSILFRHSVRFEPSSIADSLTFTIFIAVYIHYELSFWQFHKVYALNLFNINFTRSKQLRLRPIVFYPTTTTKW